DRVRRTVTRDRNRPCVIGWSLGNESSMGVNVPAMADLVRELDPSRFVHYEPDWEGAAVDVMSRMYTHPDELAAWATRDEPALEDPAADSHRRQMPFLLCEYVHAMGTGPGGIAEYQELFESHERLNGGFVWEWLEHGIRRTTAAGVPYFAYGGDFGEAVHDGNFVCDGLVSADREPRPGLVDWKTAVQPLRMSVADDLCTVAVRSLFDFTNASHLELRWEVAGAQGVTLSGTYGLLDVLPGETVTMDLPDAVRDGMAGGPDPRVLTLSAVLASDLPWASAGHEIAWAQRGLAELGATIAATPRATVSTAAHPRSSAGGWELGPATFAGSTGLLTSLGGLPVDGPRLGLWRAPTDNDNGRDRADRLNNLPDSQRWAAQGLHRLVSRLVSVEADEAALTIVHRVAAPVFDRYVDMTSRWTSEGDAVTLETTLVPQGDWGPSWPRIGLDLVIDEPVDFVDWSGYGPGQRYPDTGAGTRLGWWASSLDDLQVPYVRPQENGSRVVLGWVRLTDAAGRTLTVASDEAFSFSARPWSVAALAAADHTPDLVPDGRTHLALDHRRHGIGTAACGPGVLPAYRLQPEHLSAADLTFRYTFEVR
ncbi:MAG: glycoside hydrolase family 2 TIM barrel-domain containing protein, partial [Lapillicoccus sp.]